MKRIHIAIALVLLIRTLPPAFAQATEKNATPQKPVAKEQSSGEKEKTESLSESQTNFLQPEVVELRPSRGVRITLKMSDSSRTVYEAIGQQAKITVLFDPDYTPRNISVDLNGVSLLDALKIVAFQSRTFWRAVTSDAIFIAQDTQAKRREFEQQTLKTFTFPNVSAPTDLQDIVNAIRTIVEVQRIQQIPSHQAVIIRATPEQLAATEKVVDDLNRTQQKTGGQYRLEFKISDTEEDKKATAAAKTYVLLVQPRQIGKLRMGSKVPIDTGENKKGYMDVGKNIDCGVISETERTVSLRLSVESSAIVYGEHGAAQPAASNPVVQGTRIETNVIVELGSPTIVTSFQDPADGHRFQIEVTATRTKSKE
jgi:hypothetical protein